MSSILTLPGITSRMVQTQRINMHALFSGPSDAEPILFVHGNGSSSTFWEETMLALPKQYRGIAIDLRGYGDTEDLTVDATRGFGDFVDDIQGLMSTLGINQYHVVGHSLGGALLFQLSPIASSSLLSITLVDPGSPYGFGGTKDIQGTPYYDDFACSGGGVVSPEYVTLLSEKNRGSESPQSPRNVIDFFYWKPPFKPEREEDLLSSLLTQKVGPNRYPGDFVPSPNWPNSAPGLFGPINAASPKYLQGNVARFVSMQPKPRILWIRGADDQVVSDESFFDMGMLGKLGLVPGWPGDEICPPQPMVSQTKAVLEQYKNNGGTYMEHVIADAGHTPFVEKPLEFMSALLPHLSGR